MFIQSVNEDHTMAIPDCSAIDELSNRSAFGRPTEIPETADRPRSTRRNRMILTTEQLRAVVRAIAESPAKQDQLDAIRTISNTGLRPGELFDLRWSDVDFFNSRISVLPAKSGYFRYVPFGPKTARLLTERKQRGQESKLVFGPSPSRTWRRTAHLLTAVTGNFGSTSVTPRILRYTFAWRLLATGASITSLYAIMGYRTSLMFSKFESDTAFLWKIITSDYARLEEV